MIPPPFGCGCVPLQLSVASLLPLTITPPSPLSEAGQQRDPQARQSHAPPCLTSNLQSSTALPPPSLPPPRGWPAVRSRMASSASRAAGCPVSWFRSPFGRPYPMYARPLRPGCWEAVQAVQAVRLPPGLPTSMMPTPTPFTSSLLVRLQVGGGGALRVTQAAG